MKRKLILTLAIGGLWVGFSSVPCRAEQTNETHWIQVLCSAGATPKERDDACEQLKRIGTSRSVDALARLLTDEQLAQTARDALETMPGSAASKALIDSLSRTSGPLQVGIIHSLAIRGEKSAVPALGRLLASADENVATASVEALGRIGGNKSLQLLEQSVGSTTGAVHQAEIDALLMSANRRLDAGKHADALKAFQEIYILADNDAIRAGAFRGILLASGKNGIAQMIDAILNGDGARQSAALQVAAIWQGTEVTRALAEALPKCDMPVQLALIQCLAQRGDPVGMSVVANLVKKTNDDISTAAINALGTLGDDSVVELLAEKAAAGPGAKRNAARQSLLDLNRGAVTQRMLALLKTASLPAKIEVMRALSGRGDQAAVPVLVELAQNGTDEERGPAFQALGQLANSAQIPRLVRLVAEACAEDSRSSAADALSSVFQRVQSPGAKLDVAALVTAVQGGNVDTRLALLPVCSEVTQEPVRGAIRAAVADSDTRIHEAGIHALCDTKDPDLLPDLLKLACDTNRSSVRLLAIRGCVRLTTQEDGVQLPNATKLNTMEAILNTALDTQEKQVLLSGMGTIADPKSLKIATQMLNDTAVRAEAEQAVIDIAIGLAKSHPAQARNALKKIAKESVNADTQKSAEAALKKIK